MDVKKTWNKRERTTTKKKEMQMLGIEEMKE